MIQLGARVQKAGRAMKNIQVIDGAQNATFSIFQATDEEFELLFPGGTDVAFREDIEERLDQIADRKPSKRSIR
ncbi:hypothetical protein ACVIGB_000655 [Bradyrhizobium sp. USDA 4341]